MPPTRPRLAHLATLCAVTLLGACSERVQMGSGLSARRQDARYEPGSRAGATGMTMGAIETQSRFSRKNEQ
ncbi:MAG: hypothetical protein M3495_21710 [Pseudomonadota bacterium]|nr:hypothetical protein [Gammaproteobacteria bacterium]MDQ3584044.1 hypothetical protein [Pseudomonadota bacterium]